MAEEQVADAPAPKKKKSSFLIVIIGASVAGLVIAALLYMFVLKDRLADENDDTGSDLLTAIGTNADDPISPDVVTVDFIESVVTVKMPEGSDLPASYLSFQVTFECNNQSTADLVNKHMARFVDLVNKEHEFKTRAEVGNPRMKENMQKAIRLKGNSLLLRLQKPGEIDQAIRINKVLHTKYMVTDN